MLGFLVALICNEGRNRMQSADAIRGARLRARPLEIASSATPTDACNHACKHACNHEARKHACKHACNETCNQKLQHACKSRLRASRMASMYLNLGVSSPASAIVAPASSAGRLTNCPGGGGAARRSKKGKSASPKWCVASRGSSAGRMSTPSIRIPRPSRGCSACDQMQSEAIRCNQMSLGYPDRPEAALPAIGGTQGRQSELISGPQRQSELIRSIQMSSEVICGTQRRSAPMPEAIRRTQRSSPSLPDRTQRRAHRRSKSAPELPQRRARRM